MVTSNGLVLWVIGLNERFWPPMTPTGINVLFFNRANLYCCTNSLSIKHVGAPKSISVWASIIINFLHLTMIVTKKHCVGYEDWMGPFSLHDASRSNLIVLTKTKHAHFLLLWLWIDNRNGKCCMWSKFIWTFMSNMTWFSTIQTKIICTLVLFFLFRERFEFCLSIYMGLSYGKVVEGWANIVSGKFLYVVDVGSWRLSCWRSKSLLSH